MAKFYGLRIQDGDMSLKDVPKLWKASTEKWLKANIQQTEPESR